MSLDLSLLGPMADALAGVTKLAGRRQPVSRVGGFFSVSFPSGVASNTVAWAAMATAPFDLRVYSATTIGDSGGSYRSLSALLGVGAAGAERVLANFPPYGMDANGYGVSFPHVPIDIPAGSRIVAKPYSVGNNSQGGTQYFYFNYVRI